MDKLTSVNQTKLSNVSINNSQANASQEDKRNKNENELTAAVVNNNPQFSADAVSAFYNMSAAYNIANINMQKPSNDVKASNDIVAALGQFLPKNVSDDLKKSVTESVQNDFIPGVEENLGSVQAEVPGASLAAQMAIAGQMELNKLS